MLRESIAATAPEAGETISYGMPAFRYHGRALVAYAGFKAHCSLFPMSAAFIKAHRRDFAPWAIAKRTIRFQPDHPLPRELVTLIVIARMAQIDARRP